jgi:hypothetical protein
MLHLAHFPRHTAAASPPSCLTTAGRAFWNHRDAPLAAAATALRLRQRSAIFLAVFEMQKSKHTSVARSAHPARPSSPFACVESARSLGSATPGRHAPAYHNRTSCDLPATSRGIRCPGCAARPRRVSQSPGSCSFRAVLRRIGPPAPPTDDCSRFTSLQHAELALDVSPLG